MLILILSSSVPPDILKAKRDGLGNFAMCHAAWPAHVPTTVKQCFIEVKSIKACFVQKVYINELFHVSFF